MLTLFKIRLTGSTSVGLWGGFEGADNHSGAYLELRHENLATAIAITALR